MADKKKQGAKKQGGKKAAPTTKQRGEISMDELGKVAGGLARKGRAGKKRS